MSLSGWNAVGLYHLERGSILDLLRRTLCGVISASAGNDLYLSSDPGDADWCHRGSHLLQAAFLVLQRRFKIDDAVGAVAVHGYGGFLGVVVAGFMLWGTPSSPFAGYAHITPWGNFIGAVIMFALGFFPTYILAKILDGAGLLRVPPRVELEGLDFATNEAMLVAVAELNAAEKAMIK